MTEVKQERWEAAQVAEYQYWDGMNLTELFRICGEKPEFLEMVGKQELQFMFDDKEILEIGVGPLGISLASFYPEKHKIKRLVKLEPLARILLTKSSLMTQTWAIKLIEWVHSLSEEGDYIQSPGEQIGINNEFDTVIIYNVLDHVKAPQSILRNAYKALRNKGQILVGVDCKSVVGRIKFEYILRNIAKGEIIVEAHPHTFLPNHVVKMLTDVGFQNIKTIGVPGLISKLAGSSFRPAFIGTKN